MSTATTAEPPACLPTFFDNLDSFTEAPEGVAKLRELILDLAVRGKLVEQDENDEPASVSVDKIALIKSRLLDEKKIQKDKKFAPTVATEPPWELPDSWSWVRLQNAFEVVRGGSPRPAGDLRYFGGDIPWITVREITKDDGTFLTETRDCITELGSEKSHFVHPDDLLLTNSGATLGVPKINKITGCINDGVAFLNCFHELIDKEYAYYFLTQQTPAFRAINQGMGQPNLNTPILAGGFFPLPPLSEQRRIVSKVDGLMSLCDELESRGTSRVRLRDRASRSCLERLVSSRSRRDLASAWQRLSNHFEMLYDTPETLAHLRQSILQLAVQGKLVPQDPNDEPADESLRRIEQEKSRLAKAGEIPKPRSTRPINGEMPYDVQPGWRWTRLGDISLYIEAGWSPRCESHPRERNEWGVLKISAVTWDVFNPNENKALPAGVVPRDECEVKAGDFVMSRANTAELVAKSVVIDETPSRLMLNDKLLRVVFSDDVDKRYVNLFNNCLVARSYYESVASGTSVSMRNVSRDNVANLAIPLPPLAEQKRIVAKVDHLLSQCDEFSARLRDRQSATQQLLTATIHQLLEGSQT